MTQENLARTKINRIKTKLREEKVDAALLRFELDDLERFFESLSLPRPKLLVIEASDICDPHVCSDLSPEAVEEINSIIRNLEPLVDKMGL